MKLLLTANQMKFKSLSLLLTALLISSCGGGGGGGGSSNETESGPSSSVTVDYSFDSSKFVELNNATGYYFNALRIYVRNSSLREKTQFESWLESITDMDFIIKISDSNIPESYSWIVEFPNSSQSSMSNLFDSLKAHGDVFEVVHVHSVNPNLSPEDRKERMEGIRKNSNLAESNEAGDPLGDKDSGSWHLGDIGWAALKDQGFALHSNVVVGVYDGVMDEDHEDICGFTCIDSNTVEQLTPMRDEYLYTQHGLPVVATISGSIINNGLGTRGVSTSPVKFFSKDAWHNYCDDKECDMDEFIDYALGDEGGRDGKLVSCSPEQFSGAGCPSNSPRIINFSQVLFCTESYRCSVIDPSQDIDSIEQYKDSVNEPEGTGVYSRYKVKALILRKYMARHSHVLFIFGAGNENQDARYINGIFHYDQNGLYSPLDNLIVVGGHSETGVLVTYSNFGESVDISAPTGFYAPACVDEDNASRYYQEKFLYPYGRGNVTPYDTTDGWGSETLCSDLGSFNGTSAAAPVVSGAVSLLWALDSRLTPAQIKRLLVDKSGKAIKERYIEFESSKTNPIPGGEISKLDLEASFKETIEFIARNAKIRSMYFATGNTPNDQEEVVVRVLTELKATKATIKVTSSSGAVINEQEMDKLSEHGLTLTIGPLPAGSYNVSAKVYDNQGQFVDGDALELIVSELNEEQPQEEAPLVSNLTASSNSSGRVSGSFNVSHPSGKVKNLRIHYSNSSDYRPVISMDLGSAEHSEEQTTSNPVSFEFDAQQWAGETVYYKIEIASPNGTKPDTAPNGTVNIPASADTAPRVTELTANAQSNGFVTGSFQAEHISGQVKNVRVHFSNDSEYRTFESETIGSFETSQNDGLKSFEFDASQWAGQKVYYKVQIASPKGKQLLPTPAGSVDIPEAPEEDAAPSVSDLSANASCLGRVSGSFNVSHSSGKMKNLRVHYADNQSYAGSRYVDIGSYNSEQNTGNKSFAFDADEWAGDRVYYKVEVASPSGKKPSSAPSGSLTIPSSADDRPSVSSLTASASSTGRVSGSFRVSHSCSKVTKLRVHYANNSSYSGSKFVNVGSYNSEQSTGSKSFSFDASEYAGERVYYKVEVESPNGVKPSGTASSSVVIPAAADEAPTVTNLSASSNSSARISGSFRVSHPSNRVKKLRVHYADNSSYSSSNHVDIGSYNSEQNTGNKSFSFDGPRCGGERIYYKVEVESPDGKKPSSTPSGSLTIPSSADEAPTVTSFTASSNSSGRVSGSFRVSHACGTVKKLRIHFANNSSYSGSQSVTIGSYNSEQSTGNKSFSFDASRWAGQRIYYKVEVESPNGTKPSSTPSGRVTISSSEPAVTSISPTSVDLNQTVTFTVYGRNFPSTLAVSVGGCENGSVSNVTSTSARLRCTTRGSSGNKPVYVKDRSGGNLIDGWDDLSVRYR